MPVFPTCDFPLLDRSEAIDIVGSAVAKREPFSLVRLGDGEAVVLSYGDHLSLEDLSYLHGHWGSQGVSLGSVAEVNQDLQNAITNADLVGVRDDILDVDMQPDMLDRPRSEVRDFVISSFRMRDDERKSLSTSGARRLALLHQVLSHTEWASWQRFCSAWIHWDLLTTGALEAILKTVTSIGLVTARPELQYMVSRRFEVHTTTVTVPDKFIEAPDSEAGRHVPDRYHTIKEDLAFPEGTVVLVGAGIPGKVYCNWLKEAGSIAIDVGSVFDAWIGKASRPLVLQSRFGVAGGNRVPLDLQLRAPTSTEQRRILPRWKTSGSQN
jgi:hypothetical protein